MATRKSTSTPVPEKRPVPLSDIRILEIISPDGSTVTDPHDDTLFPVNPGYALALQRSITWSLTEAERLRDPVELVSMVGTIGKPEITIGGDS